MYSAENLESTAAKLLSDRSSCRCGSDRDLTRSPGTQSVFTVSRCAARVLSNLKHWMSGSSAPFESLDRVAAEVPAAAETGTSRTMTQRPLEEFRCEAIKSSHSRRFRKFEAGWHANLALATATRRILVECHACLQSVAGALPLSEPGCRCCALNTHLCFLRSRDLGQRRDRCNVATCPNASD